MDKIARIRQEIDKRYAEYRAKMKTDDFTYYEGMADALDLFEQFLDTLSEEPDKSLEEAAEEYANKHYSEWDESWDDYNGHNVEPENDKLELIDAFIAGAKWVSIYGNDIKEL